MVQWASGWRPWNRNNFLSATKLLCSWWSFTVKCSIKIDRQHLQHSPQQLCCLSEEGSRSVFVFSSPIFTAQQSFAMWLRAQWTRLKTKWYLEVSYWKEIFTDDFFGTAPPLRQNDKQLEKLMGGNACRCFRTFAWTSMQKPSKSCCWIWLTSTPPSLRVTWSNSCRVYLAERSRHCCCEPRGRRYTKILLGNLLHYCMTAKHFWAFLSFHAKHRNNVWYRKSCFISNNFDTLYQRAIVNQGPLGLLEFQTVWKSNLA